ncbi:hypothetical protein TKK_0004996 [Trichogramma kaykai]
MRAYTGFAVRWIFCFMVIIGLIDESTACDQTIVETETGRLEGSAQTSILGDEFCAFKGIPYAEPPINELRFKDPLPAEPWQGVRKASNYSEACLQYNYLLKRVEGSEDCLYLNVFAKTVGNDSTLRPVMVWIHGGAFAFGSGDDSFYGPDYFMRKDVVLVTFNYRLGIFGFLNLEDRLAPGNQGLKDQVAALKWVHDNVEHFGGDPDRVTIFGESAGAASVHYLTLSPMAEGLFSKAIMQSGVALNPWALTVPISRQLVVRMCARLGNETEDSEEILELLRSTEASELVDAQRTILTKRERIQTLTPFGPSVDDESDEPFMPIDPVEASARGIHLPIIIGYNSREGIYYLAATALGRNYRRFNRHFRQFLHPYVLELWRDKYNGTSDSIKRLYFGNKRITRRNKGKIIDLHGDLYFVEGIHSVVRTQVEKSNNSTYLYRYGYDRGFSVMKTLTRTRELGAAHADELTNLFRMRAMERFRTKPLLEGFTDYRLMEQMIDMWVNFATTGSPTGNETVTITPVSWKPVDDANKFEFLNLNTETSARYDFSALDSPVHRNRLYILTEKMFPLVIILLHVKIILSCDIDIVETKLGKVQGFSDTGLLDTEWCSFLGIPYAKPPLGDLRFRDPVPAEPWSDVRMASNYSNFCTQFDIPYKRPGGSEDCLYLNVFTKRIKPDQPRPVMVWIHGGAFNLGSGDNMLYGPDYYMRKDIVLVTLNYRLGIFGFLNLEDKLAPGNQGLKDQVMALKWVQDNIASFGGDPNSVTIFGESAGSASVHYLALSPMTKGLFHRAIMQSGVVLNPWARARINSWEVVYYLCSLMGFESRDHAEIMNFLRGADNYKLTDIITTHLHPAEDSLKGMIAFVPSVDDEDDNPFMPVDPVVAAQAGIQMPVIIGHNDREGILFVTIVGKDFIKLHEEFDQLENPYVADLLSNEYDLAHRDLKKLYNISDNQVEKGDKSYKEPLVDYLGDVHFVEGVHRAAKIQAEKSSHPTYMYRYEFDQGFSLMKHFGKTKMSGAAHADDLIVMWRFHILEKFKMKPLEKDSPSFKIMEHMIAMWTNFAIHGTPTPSVTEETPVVWTPITDGNQFDILSINATLEKRSIPNIEQFFKNAKN